MCYCCQSYKFLCFLCIFPLPLHFDLHSLPLIGWFSSFWPTWGGSFLFPTEGTLLWRRNSQWQSEIVVQNEDEEQEILLIQSHMIYFIQQEAQNVVQNEDEDEDKEGVPSWWWWWGGGGKGSYASIGRGSYEMRRRELWDEEEGVTRGGGRGSYERREEEGVTRV